MINGVATQLHKILDEYAEKVNETTDECMKDVAKSTAAELKKTSPTSRGHTKYARSWTVTKKGHQYIVHNKKHYRLTHLLEKGHVIKNQYGTYDRTRAQKHIKPAEEHAQAKLIKELETKL